jgi:flagellar basal-body rod protein FlgB
MSILDTTQIALEAAMRGSLERQTLLTNNLANVDTPGYQRQDLDFQGTLNAALDAGQSPDQVSFQPVTDQQVVRADGNGVDAEKESANVAENGLLYQELTQIAASREQIFQTAIGSKS